MMLKSPSGRSRAIPGRASLVEIMRWLLSGGVYRPSGDADAGEANIDGLGRYRDDNRLTNRSQEHHAHTRGVAFLVLGEYIEHPAAGRAIDSNRQAEPADGGPRAGGGGGGPHRPLAAPRAP